jgi:hypothetical protein
MKATNLTSNLLPKGRYETFKALMEEQGAHFTATELGVGTNGVELRGCRVEYGPPFHFMTREELSRHDVDADWQSILIICEQFGFQPK